jgi:hypothetical protein
MTTPLATAHDLGIALVEALGLPKLTTRLDLVVDVDQPVMVRTEGYVETDVKDELIKRMSEYRLVRREIAE